MKIATLALAVALVAGSAFAAEPEPVFSSGFDARAPWVVEFHIGQNLSVQTVTCADYFASPSHLEGTGCATTGPLLAEDGDSGHFTVTFDFADGTHAALAGCSLPGSFTITPGYVSLGVNCTHG